MKVYAGIDLHSNNSVIGFVDGQGRRLGHVRVGNELGLIYKILESPNNRIEGVVVESTYNWYWLVDGLMSAGYRCHLANPAGIQRYKGLKYASDRDDAYWLAEMLRLGILPEGFIYPKEDRPVRDLLRTRSRLVSHQVSLSLSLQNLVAREAGVRLESWRTKALRTDPSAPYLTGSEETTLAGQSYKETLNCLVRRIKTIEKAVEAKVSLRAPFERLLSIPGVGKILAMTIMVETGPIQRFPHVGDYVSYCRKVSSQWLSNQKVKGHGNAKNGNRYLSWAFAEAAEHARRHDGRIRSYFERKKRRTNSAVAHTAVARKLARAVYHMMKDGSSFDVDRCFA